MPAQVGDPPQHIVGTLRGLDGEHVIVRDHRSLSHVERSEPREQIKRARNVGVVGRRRATAAEHALGNDDLGRYRLNADDPQPLFLREPGHAGEQPIVTTAKKLDEARHQTEGLPIEADLAERWPQQCPDEQNIAALFRPRQAKKPAELAKRDPVMCVLLDGLAVRPTFDREHNRPAAAPHDGIGDRAWKASAAADERN